MKSIDQIEEMREALIQQGASKEEIIRKIGPACAGWPYVFGAWGEECTPKGRKKRARDDHPTIVSSCQVLSGKAGTCAGCKWDLPVRMYDCRGFVKWLFEQAGIQIAGQGATSQWKAKSNWVIQGPISEMPEDKICAVFTGNETTKDHIGIYLGDGSTVECSVGVQYFKPRKSKWKYYALPAGLYGDQPQPQQPDQDQDPDGRPTLRRESKGEYVQLLQTRLIQLGYSLPRYGADGSYGNETMTAVMNFQRDNGIASDGVCGPRTWEALDRSEPMKLYTVYIPHLPLYKAEAFVAAYGGAYMSEEEGGGI